MEYAVTRIISTNDRNGNPKRGWLVRKFSNENSFFIEEGLGGDRVLYEFVERGNYVMVGYINVQPSEYKRLVHDYSRF